MTPIVRSHPHRNTHFPPKTSYLSIADRLVSTLTRHSTLLERPVTTATGLSKTLIRRNRHNKWLA